MKSATSVLFVLLYTVIDLNAHDNGTEHTVPPAESNSTSPELDNLMYDRALNSILSATANRILAVLSEDKKANMVDCIQSVQNNQQYSNCISPYVNLLKTGFRSGRRRRYSEPPQESMLQFFLNWTKNVVRGVKNGVPMMFNRSAKKEQNERPENVCPNEGGMPSRARFPRSSGYFSDVTSIIERALNSEDIDDFLPNESEYPEWMSNMTKQVRSLINEMKSYDDLPNLRLMSPKIFALSKTDNRTFNILSPEFLSLDGLATGPLKRGEVLALLDIIVEAGGNSDLKKKIESLKNNSELGTSGPKSAKLSVASGYSPLKDRSSEEVWDVFTKLEGSYSDQQLHNVRNRGYEFLSADQVGEIYGNNISVQFLEHYSTLSDQEKDLLLLEIIEDIGLNRTKRNTKKADALLKPLIQSPLLGVPSVLGTVAISPIIFSPVILHPFLLHKHTFEPLLFSPVILSPALLSPVILKPIMFSPFILTPLLLSPVILSPLAFTPLIGVPALLNPIMLSPGIFNPLILCPHSLSPLILSPQVHFHEILSPGYLSPGVKSPCKGCIAVGSPCLLC